MQPETSSFLIVQLKQATVVFVEIEYIIFYTDFCFFQRQLGKGYGKRIFNYPLSSH